MKMTRLLLMALLCSFVWMSCNGDDEESSNKVDPEGDCFTATIDGEDYSGEVITSVDNSSFLSITSVAGDLDPKTFTITIGSNNGFAPGTYNIESLNVDDDLFFATYSAGLLLTSYTSTTGTLVVEDLDVDNLKVNGTFEFEAETSQGETISITNGVFDVTYE